MASEERGETAQLGHTCTDCVFGPSGHEIVVRRGVFPAHDFTPGQLATPPAQEQTR